MAHKILRMFLFSFLFFSSTLFAASFRCEGKLTKVESAICDDKVLSELDSELSNLYKQVYEASSDKSSLKKEQLKWLKLRNSCSTNDCIKDKYIARIADLKQRIVGDIEKVLSFHSSVNDDLNSQSKENLTKNPSIADKNAVHTFELKESMSGQEYCAGLLKFTNTEYSNREGVISEQLNWKSLENRKFKNVIGEIRTYGPFDSYLELDVDGDNKNETVIRNNTMFNHRYYHRILILDGKVIDKEYLFDMKDLRDEWMIYYGGNNYSWSAVKNDSVQFGWLDIVEYQSKPVFVYLDSLNYTNQRLMYFELDPEKAKKTARRSVVGIKPLCLFNARNGFKTKYMR